MVLLQLPGVFDANWTHMTQPVAPDAQNLWITASLTNHAKASQSLPHPGFEPVKPSVCAILSEVPPFWPTRDAYKLPTLTLLDLFTPIIFDEECKLWSFSWCKPSIPLLFIPCLYQTFPPSTLYNDSLSPCLSLNLRARDSHPNKERLIYFYLHFKASVFKRREDKEFSDGG